MTKELQDKFAQANFPKKEAEEIISKLGDIIIKNDSQTAWSEISKTLLSPKVPFEIHQILFDFVYSTENNPGPNPAWIPSSEQQRNTVAYDFWNALGLNSLEELHIWSCKNRMVFWEEVTNRLKIQFSKRYEQIAEFNNIEFPNWYKGGRMNIVDSCFENNDKNKVAITFKAEGRDAGCWSFGELEKHSSKVANGLIELGISKGDKVAVDMVMTADSVAIYLGIIMAGCAVVSIPDSLAPTEIKKRLKISNAKLIFTQDILMRSGKQLPMYVKILEANPERVIVIPTQDTSKITLRKQDLLWNDFLSDDHKFNTVQCDPMEHINILFSSGTTGVPKAIPWNHSTPVKCAADGLFHHDIHKGDMVSWPTNLGWMMGPWLIFASFLNNASIALFYGSPTGREFGSFVQDTKVNMLGVVPSIVKQWRATNCLKGLDWSSINNYSSTGESSNQEDMFWLMGIAGYKPIIEYCGGTEIGGGYICGSMVQPSAPAHFTTPAMGIDIKILNESGESVNQGEVFIIGPSMGLSVELLNQNHHDLYFVNTPIDNGIPLRKHGDEIEKVSSGFYKAHGRVDDTMNLGGIKISSIEIERILNKIAGVLETAAIAVNLSKDGPAELIVYVVLEGKGNTDTKLIKDEFQRKIKMELNPLFKIKDVFMIDKLPRTASNKVMRRVLRKQALDNS